MQVLNYLFCRRPRDTCPVKDGCLKVAAAGIGMAMGVGTIYYIAKSVKSTITQENAQYCANQTLTLLEETHRQLQIYTASCIPDEPGSNMSSCNPTLLPKLVNVSCQDVPVAANYLPIMFAVAAIAAFGLFMGRSMLASFDQQNEQNKSSYFLVEGALWNCSTDDSTTFSDTYHQAYGTAKTSLLMPPYHRNKQNEEASSSATPEEYSWNHLKDDESGSVGDTLHLPFENANS